MRVLDSVLAALMGAVAGGVVFYHVVLVCSFTLGSFPGLNDLDSAITALFVLTALGAALGGAGSVWLVSRAAESEETVAAPPTGIKPGPPPSGGIRPGAPPGHREGSSTGITGGEP